ncbi:putative orphan protein; putative signal peptide [Pseudoalteromonas luteoviolacea B = ATCC 29581]|nr:putative orphan protein; putative signal peptide [Pseudoalteromonas luteoviolacea B = ATCC 29581]
MTFRISLIVAAVTLSGCQLIKQPAPLLSTPKKPPLATQVYEVAYSSVTESARVKSVQLPAHPIKKGDTVFINSSRVSLTAPLNAHIIELMNKKGLRIVDHESANYLLTLQQLDLEFVEDKNYKIQLAGNKERLALLAALPQQQTCKNVLASISMRLTHNQSSDVIWFAKASIDTASFQNKPLRYQVIKSQQIANEQQVIEFVQSQNTEEARLVRSTKHVTIPKYVVSETLSKLTKRSGACSETEVSALTPDLQRHLSKVLIEKITVKG